VRGQGYVRGSGRGVVTLPPDKKMANSVHRGSEERTFAELRGREQRRLTRRDETKVNFLTGIDGSSFVPIGLQNRKKCTSVYSNLCVFGYQKEGKRF
jgi:hypothetical protein